jgi:hypothetical protein
VSEPLRYPVPWRDVIGLWRHVKNGTETSVDAFTASVARRIAPEPLIEGGLPDDPRFVLAANHYQRKGLWILHTATVLTRAVRERYGEGDPPVRWLVTANWPPVRFGPLRFPSPGDWLLPRVAHALACYPVSFAGTNPAFTPRTFRRLLRDARTMRRPIGIFPEGAAGVAGQVGSALPGVGRLLQQLKLPVVPARVSERGRFVVRFGPAIEPAELAAARDAAELVMSRIRALI